MAGKKTDAPRPCVRCNDVGDYFTNYEQTESKRCYACWRRWCRFVSDALAGLGGPVLGGAAVARRADALAGYNDLETPYQCAARLHATAGG